MGGRMRGGRGLQLHTISWPPLRGGCHAVKRDWGSVLPPEVRSWMLRVMAPLCRVVPRAANRNEHDCRWQSYLYYAVTPSGVTEGV